MRLNLTNEQFCSLRVGQSAPAVHGVQGNEPLRLGETQEGEAYCLLLCLAAIRLGREDKL
jgi:hypothetical protein